MTMTAKKQTAVMFFIESMTKEHPDFMAFIHSNPEIYNKALQMEREQIEKAVIYGMAEEVRERYSDKKLHLKPKGSESQYYTDTYGE